MSKNLSTFTLDAVVQRILELRDQRVMLDEDLAVLYGVETGALVRAVKRNLDRFPEDFIFQLSEMEWENLRCQFGISSLRSQNLTSKHGGRRYPPYILLFHHRQDGGQAGKRMRINIAAAAVYGRKVFVGDYL